MPLNLPDSDFSIDYLIAYTKRKLGASRVCVELEDEDIQDAIIETVEKLSEVIGNQTIKMLDVSGDGRYEVRGIGRGILEVNPVGPASDSYSELSEGSIICCGNNTFGFPIPVESRPPRLEADYLEIVQHSTEMKKRVMGTEFAWYEHGGYLHLDNLPSGVTSVMLLCIDDIRDLETIPTTYRRFIKEHVVALCKVTLGEIRSKFQSLPGAGEQVSLNGETIKTEGTDKIRELDEWLKGKYEDLPEIA